MNMASRMMKWFIELFEYGVIYESRGPIKAQVLADFVAELTVLVEKDDTCSWWKLSVDEASNLKSSGARIKLEGLSGVLV